MLDSKEIAQCALQQAGRIKAKRKRDRRYLAAISGTTVMAMVTAIMLSTSDPSATDDDPESHAGAQFHFEMPHVPLADFNGEADEEPEDENGSAEYCE